VIPILIWEIIETVKNELGTYLKKKELYKILGNSEVIRVFQNPYGRPADRAKIRRMDSLSPPPVPPPSPLANFKNSITFVSSSPNFQMIPRRIDDK
jgi:hypothetical protein